MVFQFLIIDIFLEGKNFSDVARGVLREFKGIYHIHKGSNTKLLLNVIMPAIGADFIKKHKDREANDKTNF